MTFTLEPEADLTADNEIEESFFSAFEAVERAGMLNDSGDVAVEAASRLAISGTTGVALGTEITMRARATCDNLFLKTANHRVAIASDGTFDSTDVAENTTFTVTASVTTQFADGALTADGTVGAAATPTPTPEPTDEPTIRYGRRL
ncbi:BGTF surface domain-containing protein [Halosegnis longus]|uniref:Uncharacterized protein n=1 Tax=Halosegnis longus TaxID=2216012 RepID=A0AAJ4UWQ3_9EURY|nr:hypothetical protein Nmn1133_10905 [Salella cibi]